MGDQDQRLASPGPGSDASSPEAAERARARDHRATGDTGPIDPDPTSATLLLRVRDPADQHAWEAFVDRYGPMILRWCRAWFPRDADDMVQEVLKKLVHLMAEFDYDAHRGRFRGWLATVTDHLMADLRRRGRRPLAGGPGLRDRLDLEPARTDLEARLAAEYDLELLGLARDRVRRRVDPRTWAAYEETAERGRKAAEVARDLGMPVGSVSQAKYSVRALLQREVRILQGPEGS